MPPVARFVLGFALCAGVGLGLLWLFQVVNPEPCRFRTVSYLLVPLVLGPLSIGLATNRRMIENGWGPFNIGMIAASLFPVLWKAMVSIAALNGLCGKGAM
ncbi:hypothetical protein [Deinococcus cellulosilyticus]|uniref:Uncharacterized protein n=1 Tax=Deinococcus cellulosilyticus (strain DSM 18568 / NBRC 106333 / KACC 11606 / 5516J-15) TaxID=1223518 RepID=A0A511N517_DEIC1|nr:hypothetical protein [Deinococcus cellulosilyticus]GEM47546.1 hypothetical protein DC3_31810 [Deinococcus cellulosilyticus NBRC 106333 = KACC 11606]